MSSTIKKKAQVMSMTTSHWGSYGKSIEQFYNSPSCESGQASSSMLGVSVIRKVLSLLDDDASQVFCIYSDINKALLKSA